MVRIKIKKRIFMFLGVLFLLIPLTFGGVYMAIDSLLVYFSYPDSFVFSYRTILLFSFSVISIPIIMLSVTPILKGKQSSIIFQKKMAKIMILGFLIMFALSLVFDLYYVSTVDSKGYIKCNGTPLGWTPMSATKYVTDKKLCLSPRR